MAVNLHTAQSIVDSVDKRDVTSYAQMAPDRVLTATFFGSAHALLVPSVPENASRFDRTACAVPQQSLTSDRRLQARNSVNPLGLAAISRPL